MVATGKVAPLSSPANGTKWRTSGALGALGELGELGELD